MERFATPFPGRIHRLGELATDVWWSWQPDARALFRRLDLAAWRSTAHNPARMLRTMESEVLQRAADDRSRQGHATFLVSSFRSRRISCVCRTRSAGRSAAGICSLLIACNKASP